MWGTSREEGALMHVWVRTRSALSIATAAMLLAACTTQFGGGGTIPQPGEPPPTAQANDGQVRVGLVLPLTAPGNAGVAAQSMKNAAEMALAEFKSPNIQLLVKDDGGTPQGAQSAAQQAINEGAEIIIGPLFAQSVSAVGQVARGRNIPVIAFSTDASVAARGVYLLSFPWGLKPTCGELSILRRFTGQAIVCCAVAGTTLTARLWRRPSSRKCRATHGESRGGAGEIPA